jgi:raffinose/stachyose/melibiose transport system permease protein
MSADLASADLAIGKVHRRPISALDVVRYVAAVLIVIFTLMPILFVITGGFKTNGQLNVNAAALPNPWILDNYVYVGTSPLFWRFLLNSILVSAGCTTLTMVLGAMTAYALSRYRFRGREAIYSLFTIGLLFPLSVAVLPVYLQLHALHLLDNAFGVIIPQVAFSMPITIIILRPFMAAIPGELQDAAEIDGATKLTFFWRILLPLSRPALVTVAVLAFITSWNSYLLPLLVFNDQNHFTLPIGVAAFQTQFNQDTVKVLAFTSLSVIPALLFFLALERQIVGGLTGSVKG